MDNDFLRDHYNYYNQYITTDALCHHKSISFRSNPDKPFVVTIGAELAAQFGGTKRYYEKGILIDSLTMKSRHAWKIFLKSLFTVVSGSMAKPMKEIRPTIMETMWDNGIYRRNTGSKTILL